ncbi:DUF975 family protein [Pseudohongiella sp. O18]|uniref:DUF975 family protein n=1 Tax=Pseudohongiella sp. O18 TaxID=2904248 RepID=UPI001F19CE67|nr:DUF975 family protein [Pseudohongiella sp. O18]
MNDELHDNVSKEDFELGVGNALGRGWSEMRENFLVFLLAVLVLTVFMMPVNIDGDDHGDVSALIGILETAYLVLLYPIINYGADMIFLRGVRGDRVEVKSIFDGFENYVNVILASLLTAGLIGIGLVVFIIPGIYVACRLAFVSYLVMDEDLDPIAAVEASWRLTRGHTWRIFLLAIVSIFVFVLGLVLLIVGVFPALIWIKASFAALYLAITGEEELLETVSEDQP